MIADRLLDQARKTPDAVFIATQDREFSYSQTASLALRFAATLAARGIRRGDHVAIVAGNSAAWIIAWFGVLAAGGVAVTLNNAVFGADIDYLVDQSAARLIIADTEWIASHHADLRDGRQDLPVIVLGDDDAFISSLGGLDQHPVEPRAASDACTILYTSGTTGLPKGVVCAHGGYLATGRHTARILELTGRDRILVFLPLFHTNPQMYALMGALHAGASLAVRSRFSAGAFFDDACQSGATGCTFVGTVLAILAARHESERKDHAMRFCIGGGTTAALAETITDRFGLFVHELYGMTEIGGWVSGSPRAEHRAGTNGRIRDDMEVRIFDTEDREVPTGEKGEIVVRPREPNLILQGYYRKPEETLAASANFWFHTGDVGSIDAEGFLTFYGRTKELIRRGGEMVAPAAIEQRLREMTGVDDCAAVGVPDLIMGEQIKVVVVSAADLAPGAVREHLARSLPGYMLPRYVEFAASIPRTQTEKILRRQLVYLDERVHDLEER